MVWARGDEIAVHRPVVVFAEGEAWVGWSLRLQEKGNQMRGCILVLHL